MKVTYIRWHFPNAFAATDGKCIALFHERGSGSERYNHKQFYSVFLLALVHYDYKYRCIYVGCQECISDSRVYNSSALKEAILNKSLNLPLPKFLPNVDRSYIFRDNETWTPFFFVADDAFP